MSIWADILAERARQEELKASGKFKYCCADEWISDLRRLSILGEEFGEVAREVNDDAEASLTDRATADSILVTKAYEARLRAELIQVAAVCVAWVENIDKRK